MAHYTYTSSNALKRPALKFGDSLEFPGTGLVYEVRQEERK